MTSVSADQTGPHFGSMPLYASGVPCSGAVLMLNQEASVDQRVSLNSSLHLLLTTGSKAAIVRGANGGSYDAVLEEALSSANQALDLLAIQGGARLTLADYEALHIVWWLSAGKSTVRMVGTSTVYMSLSAQGQGLDSHGQVVPQAPVPQAKWHDSMRYFRMSQVTDDLFDAFRNLYLALESILSTIRPVPLKGNGRPAEGEADWTKRAIVAAGALVDLKGYLPAAAVVAAGPAHDQLFTELYRTIRTSIFHAKNGRPVLLPQDQAHRHLVADALERYARLYIDLLRTALGVTFPSGGMTAQGFEAMVSQVRDPLVICITDDPSVPSDTDVSVAPAGGTAVALATTRRKDLERPLYSVILGAESVTNLNGQLSQVHRFGAVTPDDLLAEVDTLPEPLGIAGFDAVECALAMRGVNARQPRSVYST